MNRDFYEGYSMNFEDKCNAEVKLDLLIFIKHFQSKYMYQ